MDSQSQSISNQQSLSKTCGSILRRFLDGLFLLWSSASSISLPILPSHLSLHAHPAVQRGLLALTEFLTNKRHLAGLGFGMVGVGSIFAYQLFSESARNPNWYYINTFYFLFSIRLWLAIIFLSTAKFLCVPTKWKSNWVVYGLAVSVGIAGIMHYSFFVYDDISYHSFPVWYVCLFAVGLGIGFIKATDYLCHRKYHTKDGNTCRMVGIIEMDSPWSEKEATLKLLAKEYRDFNSRI